MSVNAKMKVSRVTKLYETGPTEVEFTPDYAQGRNAEWAKFTPAAVFRMTVDNPAALEQFEQGKAFTVTFEAEE